MGFDIATIVIFIVGIAFSAGIISEKLKILSIGQTAIKAFLEKELTKITERIENLEKRVKMLETKGERDE